MKTPRNAIHRAVESVLEFGARKASVYVAPDHVVTASRQRRPDGRLKSTTIILTIGKPNYDGRRFVRLCQKAGEKFPVKKVQLKFYPIGRRSGKSRK